MVERVDQALSLEGQLLHAVDGVGQLHARQLVDRGRDVGDVMKLRAEAAALDVPGPGNDQGITRAS